MQLFSRNRTMMINSMRFRSVMENNTRRILRTIFRRKVSTICGIFLRKERGGNLVFTCYQQSGIELR